MSWTRADNGTKHSGDHLPPVISGILTTSGGGLPEALQEIIHQSEEGDLLRIMSPVIDDERCVEDILQARPRGVVVRVLTTLSDRHGIQTKGWDASQDIERHDESVRRLAKAGVSLRSPGTTPHGKFVVRNNSHGLFSSANLARGSLRGSALEAGLMLSDTELVKSIANSFDRIWKGAPYSMLYRKPAVILEEGVAGPLDIATDDFKIGEHQSGIIVSGPGCGAATAWLLDTIMRARHEVILMAMSLYETDQIAGFQEVLMNALGRGVRIRALVRKEHFKIEEEKGFYPDSSTRELLQAGLELYGIPGLHAKGLVVDDSRAAILSANFNPYSFDSSREECNIEFLLRGACSSGTLAAYSEWIRALADSAGFRWLM